jgi:hypothetical protein
VCLCLYHIHGIACGRQSLLCGCDVACYEAKDAILCVLERLAGTNNFISSCLVR